MSKLHLAKGSKIPDLPDDGKIRLYSNRFCPYAQRAHLVLDAKNIPYHTININLTDKPEWFFEKSPKGKVPVIEIPSVTKPLVESLIISEYLDDQYPENPLNSKDPLQRANDKILIEQFCGFCPIFYKLLMTKATTEEIFNAFKDLEKFFLIFDEELQTRGTKFFGGSKPGFVDYMIWPWMERGSAMPFVLGDNYREPNKLRFRKLIEWNEGMREDPAVKSSVISAEDHYRFLQSMASEKFEYDF